MTGTLTAAPRAYVVEYPDGRRETLTDSEPGMPPLAVGDRLPWRLDATGAPLWLTVVARG